MVREQSTTEHVQGKCPGLKRCHPSLLAHEEFALKHLS